MLPLKGLIKFLKKLNLNIKNLLNKFSMKKKNIIPLYKTDLLGDEKSNIIKCINENWISSKGSFIEKFQEEVAARNGFTITSHKLDMFGLCSECR